MKQTEIDAQASGIWHTAYSACINRGNDNTSAISAANDAVLAFRKNFIPEDAAKSGKAHGA